MSADNDHMISVIVSRPIEGGAGVIAKRNGLSAKDAAAVLRVVADNMESPLQGPSATKTKHYQIYQLKAEGE